MIGKYPIFSFIKIFVYKSMWADPGGTAIPGQPAEEVEQAPNFPPLAKNQFNTYVAAGSSCVLLLFSV